MMRLGQTHIATLRKTVSVFLLDVSGKLLHEAETRRQRNGIMLSAAKTPPFAKLQMPIWTAFGWYRYQICNGGVTASAEPAYGAGYGTHEVGLKEPNSLSLYDMCGNVWEWCWDSCQTTDEYSTYEVDPITGVPADSCRALRGGSWGIDATCCDIPSKLIEYEFYRSARYGFRLVRTATAE